MQKAIWSIIGFGLFIIGMLALCLSMVGVQLSFLTFIDIPGRGFGFLIRLLMIFAGLIIIVLSRSDWRQEEEELDMPA
ncbi:MAG: hypothetical protein AAFV95_08840 [Bacteroidota bacterium]